MNTLPAGSRMVSLGHYQPARVVTNDELATRVETSDEWIRTRVGIHSRRVAAPDETVADMGSTAAAKTLARCGMSPTDIDLVVVATCTAMDRMPNVAARIARNLGIPTPGTFDLNVACSGFCYALATADLAIRGGASKNALVVGADKMSDFLDWDDRTTCVIFGDGAGAAVLTATDDVDQVGVGPVAWGSQPCDGTAIRLETEGPTAPPAMFRQEGKAVYRWTTRALVPVALQACERAGIEPSDLAGVVTHQANLRIIDMIVQRIGADNAVVARDIVESGNTSAASVPLAMSKLVERGELDSGDPVLLLGFGAGLAYAAQVVRCP